MKSWFGFLLTLSICWGIYHMIHAVSVRTTAAYSTPAAAQWHESKPAKALLPGGWVAEKVNQPGVQIAYNVPAGDTLADYYCDAK